MPRSKGQPRAKRKVGAQKIQVGKGTPGRGVVAPGFKPVRKKGKVVPKRTGGRSPVFSRGLPKPKAQIPARPNPRKSAPNPLRVSPSGQTRRARRYKPGTVEFAKARLFSRSPGGDTYRALQKEERRQEKLIKAVTGKKANVELRNTAESVQRGVSVKRSKSTFGAEPVATGPKGSKTPTLSALNRASNSPEVRKGQAKIDVTRTVAGAQAKELKRVLNPQVLPLKGGPGVYAGPEPTKGAKKAERAKAKPLKTPKVLRANDALPKPKVKPYAVKQQRRQVRFAAKQQAKANRKNARTLLDRNASLERRGRAGDALSRAGVIQTETRKQFRVRQARERAAARRREERKPLIDVKLDAKTFAKAGKAVAGFLTKNVRDAGDPSKIGDFGPVGDVGKGVAKGAKAVVTNDLGERAGKKVGRLAVGAGAAAVEPGLAAIRGEKRKFVVSKSGFSTPSQKSAGDVGALVWKVPVYSAQAIAENPDEQLARLAKDTGDMIKSVPAGVWMAVDQGPATVWEQIKKDYSRRYGPLLAGRDKEFRERLKREGVTSEVLDSLTALVIVGKGAGTAVQGVAKAGRLGPKGSRFADEAQRIALRKPARDADIRGVLDEGVPKPSKNFFGNVALRGVDTARGFRARRESRLVQEGKRKEISARTARAEKVAAEAGFGVPVRGLTPTKKTARKPLGGGEKVRVTGDAGVYAATRLREENAVQELGLSPSDVRGLRNSLDGALSSAGLKLGKKNPGQSKVSLDLDLPKSQVAALERVLENKSAVARVPDAQPTVLAKPPTSRLGKLREDIRLGAEMPVVPKFFDTKFFGQSATVRRKIARIASATHVQFRIEEREWEKQFGKQLKQLSEDERRGFFFAQVFGIRTPEQARQFLGPHRDAVLRLREEVKQWESEKDLISGDLWAVFDEIPKMDKILENPERVFTPKLAQFTDAMREEARRLGLLDPALKGGRRQLKMAEIGSQARMLGVRLEDYVDDIENPTDKEMQAYIRDAEVKRREAGLVTAGFFRGEGVLKERPQYSLYAAGGGNRAVKPDKRKRFTLTDYGASNTDPEVFARGAMNNIKRRYNWNKTTDLYAELADPLYRDMSPSRLIRAIEQGEINENEVVLWSPGLMREQESLITKEIAAAERRAPKDNLGLRAQGRQIREQSAGPVDSPGYTNPQDGQARVHEAIQASTLQSTDEAPLLARLQAIADLEAPGRAIPANEFQKVRFTVIPKAAHDEIFSATKPSGGFGRSVAIVQGKISRVLLANPVWLQFQVASNAFLTGLVSGTGPVAFVKAQVWWNKLPAEVKRAVEPYVGIHRWYDDQNRLGASSLGPLNGLADAYRGLKTTAFWQTAAKGNPLTAFFRADNAQNNWFRRAVLYNRVKREAYKQIGEDAGMAVRLQRQIFDGFDPTNLGPEEQMRYLLSRRDLIEDHAKYVDSILGNWTTYTAAERRVFSRLVIFYGFLRFSTKLTFYTMPMKHPLTSSIMLKLGQLQNKELKEIFGSDIPYWEIGNYYTDDGKVRLEVSRLNPYFNLYQAFIGNSREQLVTDSNAKNKKYELGPKFGGLNPLTLLSYAPPYMAVFADQLVQMQTGFGGKPWTTDGSASYKLVQQDLVGPKDRIQIAWNQILRLSPYYRALEQVGLPGRKPNTPFGPMRGKQTTDSTFWSPNPVKYSDRDVRSRRKARYNEKMIKEQGENVGDAVKEIVGSGFLPVDGRPKIESAQRFEKETAKKGKKKAKRKKSSGSLWTPSG